MTKWIVPLLFGLLLNAAPKDDVLAALEAWKSATLKKDAASLQKLLHNDLTYSHSDGRTESKSDVLGSIPAGKLNLQAIDFKEQSVRVYGNTALVKGDVSIRNPEQTLTLNVLQVWVKGPQGWQLVARQSTRLAPK